MEALFLTVHSQKNPKSQNCLLSVVLKTSPHGYQSKSQLESFSLSILNLNMFHDLFSFCNAKHGNFELQSEVLSFPSILPEAGLPLVFFQRLSSKTSVWTVHHMEPVCCFYSPL